MNLNVKFTILGLVFVLSTIFFWQALNNSGLLPSRAQQANQVNIFFSETKVECNTDPTALCLLHLFGRSADGVVVAGVSGVIEKDPVLSLAGYTQSAQQCNPTFGLDALLNLKEQGSRVSLGFGALRNDTALSSGNNCVTTVGFKPVGVTEGQEVKVGLTDNSQWQVVGASPLLPVVEANPVVVKFTASAPIPTITLIPPPGDGTQPPGNCPRRAEGDCNCSGGVDLGDHEMMRSAFRQEGQTCDVNGDGVTNSADFAAWRANNDLLK